MTSVTSIQKQNRNVSLDNLYLEFMNNDTRPEMWYDKLYDLLLCYAFACNYKNMYLALDEIAKDDKNYKKARKEDHILSILYNKSKLSNPEINEHTARPYYDKIINYLDSYERTEKFRSILEVKYCETYKEEQKDTINTIKSSKIFGLKYILIAILLRYKGFDAFVKEKIDNWKIKDLKKTVIEMIKSHEIWLHDIIELRDTIISEIDSQVTYEILYDLKKGIYEEVDEIEDDDSMRPTIDLYLKNRRSISASFKPFENKKSNIFGFVDINSVKFGRCSFIPKTLQVTHIDYDNRISKTVMCNIDITKTLLSKNMFVWKISDEYDFNLESRNHDQYDSKTSRYTIEVKIAARKLIAE